MANIAEASAAGASTLSSTGSGPRGWGAHRPKSMLTCHFRAQRDAGVIRQRRYGLERRSHLRTDDLEAHFPVSSG